jgi:hypothetical protein
MEYAKAIDVLKKLSDNPATSAEEKEAISTAVGVLSLGALALSRVKEKKARREQAVEW